MSPEHEVSLSQAATAPRQREAYGERGAFEYEHEFEFEFEHDLGTVALTLHKTRA